VPTVRKKVCLVGSPAVGKTSLIIRYVKNAFEERYLRTLGTRVYTKSLEFPASEGGEPTTLILSVWDIMGQRQVRELLQQSYFYGANGVLAVADLQRPETFRELWEWVATVREIVGPIPVQLAANKLDLVDEHTPPHADIRKIAETVGCRAYNTSAKTGENVERVFQSLAQALLEPGAAWPKPLPI